MDGWKKAAIIGGIWGLLGVLILPKHPTPIPDQWAGLVMLLSGIIIPLLILFFAPVYASQELLNLISTSIMDNVSKGDIIASLIVATMSVILGILISLGIYTVLKFKTVNDKSTQDRSINESFV